MSIFGKISDVFRSIGKAIKDFFSGIGRKPPPPTPTCLQELEREKQKFVEMIKGFKRHDHEYYICGFQDAFKFIRASYVSSPQMKKIHVGDIKIEHIEICGRISFYIFLGINGCMDLEVKFGKDVRSRVWQYWVISKEGEVLEENSTSKLEVKYRCQQKQRKRKSWLLR